MVGSDKVTELWTCDVPRIRDRKFLKAFKGAVDMYVAGRWQEAMKLIQRCKRCIPDDPYATHSDLHCCCCAAAAAAAATANATAKGGGAGG